MVPRPQGGWNRDDIEIHPITAVGMSERNQTSMIVTPDGEYVGHLGYHITTSEADALKYASTMDEMTAAMTEESDE